MSSTAFVKPKRSCLMVFLRWLFIALVSLPFALYFAYMLFFYYVQREALFPAQNRPIQISDAAAFEGLIAARFRTALGENAGFAWYMPPADQNAVPFPVIIVGHGNGEIADDWVPMAQPARELGYGVLILGYPGYGHAVGEPSKDAIVESALAAYDWLLEQPGVDRERIVIFGHSVGGAATLALAEQRPTKGAVLLSAFASIDHIARDRYLPALLAKDRFDNLAIIENYDRPVYLMHGTSDIVVLPYQAELLHEAAPQSRLKWLNCGHGGCIDDIHRFWQTLDPIMQEMIGDRS